jgi:hypothetical protein
MRVNLWFAKILRWNLQCRCGKAVAEQPLVKVKNRRALVVATPRGQDDELFPDLPARPAPIQTGFDGPSWEKIHGARE